MEINLSTVDQHSFPYFRHSFSLFWTLCDALGVIVNLQSKRGLIFSLDSLGHWDACAWQMAAILTLVDSTSHVYFIAGGGCLTG